MAPFVRDKMKQFWQQYEPTLTSMMLCSAANDILESEDRTQVLNICPSFKGKAVLELGAGIGLLKEYEDNYLITVGCSRRFTTDLAKVAEQVTAVDFIEAYVEKNKETNGHHKHLKFLAADVTELELPPQSFDIILSNWLLMYLSDEELNSLVMKMLSWVKEDGYLFVRESCYRPSGDVKRATNPTYYRSPDEYFYALQNSIHTDETGYQYRFNCQKAISMEAYIRHYGNPFQLGFVLRKMPCAPDSYESFQAFLDGNQYTEQGIRRYEFIFGKTYVSTGGETTTKEFVKKLNLTPGQLVLDVGCGAGGSAFYMARNYGVQVHGVDLSTNMITMAIKYQAEMEDAVRKNVNFEMRDVMVADYEENKFDVIYSRDTILHIDDKEALFSKFFKWLKPGGKLMISEYCLGDKDDFSEEFVQYVHQRGYHLLTLSHYGQILETVGFQDVLAEDKTTYFIEILKSEAIKFQDEKAGFLAHFSSQDFDYLVDGWNAKIERSNAGDQLWGLFTASKPA